MPFYIDYKEHESLSNKFDIIKIIADYYELNYAKAETLVNDSKFLLLIDNLNPSLQIHNIILKFIEDHSNLQFIICSEYITSRVFLEELDGLDYEKLYFKDLTRKEIRKYTEKQPGIKNESEEEVLEKISSLCTQLQLPMNYWTISLILLIYKKNNDDYSKNLFSVLDACVDEILNKKKLAIDQKSLKFEQYKGLCSQIAYFLLLNHKDNDYCASYAELLTFIENCIKLNPRIVAESRDIFDYLMEVGLLKKRSGSYTFRLNGIFEYFLAFYIKDNPQFKEEILADDSIFLSFRNELELYSGFNRNDTDFLKKIYKKTKEKFDPIIEKFALEGTIDENLKGKIQNANDFRQKVKSLMVLKPLESMIKDELYDSHDPLNTDSEVHAKKVFDTSQINFEILEKYILILARVFKNLDNVTDINLINEIFSYLLECYCNLGFYFQEEYEEVAKFENLNNSEVSDTDKIIGEEILKLMSRIMPILMQSVFYEGVGHINIKRIIENKIIELSEDSSSNQYKLFLLYFLLVDIDINSNKDRINDLLSIIKLAPLKVSIIFKLNFYLAFKAYKNPQLEAFFKKK